MIQHFYDMQLVQLNNSHSLPQLMQCIYFSVSKVANACRTVPREIYSQYSVLEYMTKGGNFHYLLFMSGLWLIIQALELCQCASDFLSHAVPQMHISKHYTSCILALSK